MRTLMLQCQWWISCQSSTDWSCVTSSTSYRYVDRGCLSSLLNFWTLGKRVTPHSNTTQVPLIALIWFCFVSNTLKFQSEFLLACARIDIWGLIITTPLSPFWSSFFQVLMVWGRGRETKLSGLHPKFTLFTIFCFYLSCFPSFHRFFLNRPTWARLRWM